MLDNRILYAQRCTYDEKLINIFFTFTAERNDTGVIVRQKVWCTTHETNPIQVQYNSESFVLQRILDVILNLVKLLNSELGSDV